MDIIYQIPIIVIVIGVYLILTPPSVLFNFN